MFDLLLCRTAWLESYTNFDEAPTGGHSYINENEGPAHESLNFKSDNKTGYYYAYLPHNARFKDGVGNASIHLEKSGATRRDEYIDGITVVIVAPHPILNRLIVIGIYHDVRVYHKPQPRPDNPGIRYYITSANIISIPSENRYFQFPKKREGWFPRPAGFGQNALWYGLFGPAEEPKLENYRRRLLRYIASLSHSPLRTPKPKNADPLSFEERLQIISTRIERRSNVRKLIETNGYCCETCRLEIDESKIHVLGSSFEAHHKKPMSELEVGKARKIRSKDFAVLCASCHCAVHKSGLVDDIEKFRNEVLPRFGSPGVR